MTRMDDFQGQPVLFFVESLLGDGQLVLGPLPVPVAFGAGHFISPPFARAINQRRRRPVGKQKQRQQNQRDTRRKPIHGQTVAQAAPPSQEGERRKTKGTLNPGRGIFTLPANE